MNDIARFGTSIDWLEVVSVLIASLSLWVAIRAINISKRNTSAGILVTLNEGFRQGWQRFLLAATEEARQYEFSELMNLIEIACAIYNEKSFSGVTRELIEDYLENNLNLIRSDLDARRRIQTMRDRPDTFKYIKCFLKRMNRLGKSIDFSPPHSNT